jgi:flagellar protein FlaF
MGFSVSGAAAIIFAAMFISFGAWYTATADSFERVSEAREDRTDAVRDAGNADLNVTQATYGGGDLTVAVENTGATQFTLAGTDLLVDGRYVTGWQSNATVAGLDDTDLWLSGETVSVTLSVSSQPDRVKVVAAHGVSDTEVVPA